MDSRPRSIFDEIEEPFEPESLKKFGHLLKRLVTSHSDFRLLMYIDVLEFENMHFRKMFEGLAASLRRRFKPYFERLRREGERFKREIAGSRLVVFDNGGHIPQVEKGAELNAVVLSSLPARRSEVYGMSYKVGDAATRSKTIIDEDIRAFAEPTGDHHPSHLHDEYAAATRFGRRIAHGMPAASLISATLTNEPPGRVPFGALLLRLGSRVMGREAARRGR